MSVKNIVPIVFFILFILSAARAQMAMNLGQHMLIKLSDKVLYGDPVAEKEAGTPYLNENFVIGTIYDYKTKYEGIPMRYNSYDDLIEFKENNQLFILDPQPRIRRIELDGRTFVVDGYESKGKIKQGYFLLLDSGKATLMSKKVVTYKEQQPPRALDIGPTPAKYSTAPDAFYYKIGDGIAMKVDNLKKMIAGFPDKQTELTEFAKKEKISPKKEDELIKLIKYYNSL